jgi:biotin-dependent carboxylase-like uncharacterized protein
MIEVIKPSIASIQDNGRPGYRNYGIPISGYMDRYRAGVANSLVGNESVLPCLEVFYSGLVLKFNRSTTIAVTGASSAVEINGEPHAVSKTLQIDAGDLLKLIPADKGLISYLSIAGGFIVPRIMESYSTCTTGYFGGMGRNLQKGDVLYFSEKSINSPEVLKEFNRDLTRNLTKSRTIRILPAPEHPFFHQQWVSETYQVENEISRMGYRLKGASIQCLTDNNSLQFSVPVLPGTVQVTGEGQLIVMMQDGPTTGGYPRIAQVIEADLDDFAQMAPGSQIRFRIVDLQNARKAYQQYASRLRRLKKPPEN